MSGVPQVGHLLNRTVAHWRPLLTADGGGGQESSWALLGTVRARLSQPSSAEDVQADRDGAEITHVVYLRPDAPVVRGDQLRDGALVLDVHAVYGPSVSVYLRADCESRQSQPPGGP